MSVEHHNQPDIVAIRELIDKSRTLIQQSETIRAEALNFSYHVRSLLIRSKQLQERAAMLRAGILRLSVSDGQFAPQTDPLPLSTEID